MRKVFTATNTAKGSSSRPSSYSFHYKIIKQTTTQQRPNLWYDSTWSIIGDNVTRAEGLGSIERIQHRIRCSFLYCPHICDMYTLSALGLLCLSSDAVHGKNKTESCVALVTTRTYPKNKEKRGTRRIEKNDSFSNRGFAHCNTAVSPNYSNPCVRRCRRRSRPQKQFTTPPSSPFRELFCRYPLPKPTCCTR